MEDKDLVWLHCDLKTPPISSAARVESGHLLRLIQKHVPLTMPHSRQMPSIGPRCHELRIQDADAIWRIVYRVDADTVVVADIFNKKTSKTPLSVIDRCKKRLAAYDMER